MAGCVGRSGYEATELLLHTILVCSISYMGAEKMSKVGFNWNSSQHSNDNATLIDSYQYLAGKGHTASQRRLEGVHVHILEKHALQAV